MLNHHQRLSAIVLAALCAASASQAQTASSPPAAPAATEEASFTITGFVVEGENPLPANLTQATLQPYLGQHSGIERLQQAALALEEVLRSRGFGFYRVVLPPQDIGGEIKLQMFKFTLGTLAIKGNQVFSNDNILRSLPQLKPGTSPNTHELARDLAVANESPSKRANVTFKQGEVADTIDATVDVIDSRTLTGFVSMNNIGNSATGYNRVTVGITHTNLFDLDHQATVTYTTSPSAPGKVHQYGGYYRAPMYQWGGIITAYYTRSSVDSGTIANALTVTGRGAFMGLMYTHYFAPAGDFRSFVSLGLDDKNFFDVSTSPTNYRTRPVTVGYTGRLEPGWGLWGYNVEYTRNLSFGGGNDSFNANANRAGATTSWYAVRLGADLTTSVFGKWVATGRFKAQASGQPLVPGEQFGIGGAQSIRGLNERVLSGDTGWQANLELLSPAFLENLRGLVFYDLGQVRRHNDAVMPFAAANSFGVGLRWSLGTSLTAGVDVAHVRGGLGYLPPGTSPDKVHFNLNWKY